VNLEQAIDFDLNRSKQRQQRRNGFRGIDRRAGFRVPGEDVGGSDGNSNGFNLCILRVLLSKPNPVFRVKLL
jgi:hypothetical protein